MKSIHSLSERLLDRYKEHIDVDEIYSYSDKIAAFEKIYLGVYPNALKERFKVSGVGFKEYYGNERFNAKNRNEVIEEDVRVKRFSWLVKPEGCFVKNSIEDYLSTRVGKVRSQGWVNFDSSQMHQLYQNEMELPILSNITNQFPSQFENEVVYSFILRVASMVFSPSYFFETDIDISSLDIGEFRRKHKGEIMNKIISPYLSENGLYDNNSLRGFDPIKWHREDPNWIKASYNGLHAPCDLTELRVHSKLLKGLSPYRNGKWKKC